MHKYHLRFVWSLSQHKNATQTTGEEVIEAVSAQDAAYVLTINKAAGKMVYFTIVSIQCIDTK